MYAEVIVLKFTRAELRLPDDMSSIIDATSLKIKLI